jgi:hypothetical protein
MAMPTNRRELRYSWAGAVGTVLAVTVLILGSYLLASQLFPMVLAQPMLNLAIVGIGGATFGLFTAWITRRRADLRAMSAQRLDLLERTRAAHVRIAQAQRILTADRRPATYTDQLRDLMKVAAEVEDVRADVEAAPTLLGPDNGAIVKGLTGMVWFLTEGYREYTSWSKSNAPTPSLDNYSRPDGPWLNDLTKTLGEMPRAYEEAVTDSKGNMRRYVYGSR